MTDKQVFNQNWTILYTQEQVDGALSKLCSAIQYGSDPTKPLVIISLLKGGLWTGYRLLNLLEEKFPGRFPDIRIGHMGLSSYGDSRTPTEVKVVHTLDLDVRDLEKASIWVVDDIWDSGETMKTACDRVRRMGGCNVHTCVLVYRCPGTIPGFPDRPNFWGFQYDGPEFFVGCGMGLGEKYRHHRALYIEKTHSQENEYA